MLGHNAPICSQLKQILFSELVENCLRSIFGLIFCPFKGEHQVVMASIGSNKGFYRCWDSNAFKCSTTKKIKLARIEGKLHYLKK